MNGPTRRRGDESATAEFDKFADEYDSIHASGVGLTGEGLAYFAEYKIVDIARDYAKYAGATSRAPKILDFGAGNGTSVPHVHKHFPNAELTCVDVSARSLALAEERYPSYAKYIPLEGTRIPFASAHFDVAYAVCVFHHIDHTQHVAMLKELWRVIRPSGCLFVFEHNPLNPVTVRIVDSCPLDENARLIPASLMKQRLTAAGFMDATIRYRLFFPHALRMFRPLERALRWLPLGGQYYVFARK